MERSYGMSGLGDAVAVEHRMTPVDFARDLGAAWGNAFSIEPTLTQSAYFRQPNRDRGIANLYHVGGGTHPGAGIPGVLMGAQVTAGLVVADHPGPTHADRGGGGVTPSGPASPWSTRPGMVAS